MGTQRDVWEHLGKTDADWAVASAPGKRHGGWENDLDTFYESGAKRVTQVLEMVPEGFGRGSALDYGSGTGRLSFSLADTFLRVTSADVSRSMAQVLQDRAQRRKITNIDIVDLTVESLPVEHDVALSLITLQHLGTMDAVDVALKNISDALRPNGYAVVDFPTPPTRFLKRVQPRWRLYKFLRTLGVQPAVLDKLSLSGISMLYESRSEFSRRLARVGLEVCATESYESQYSVMSTFVAKRV